MNVLYEDNHLLVLNKPAGIATMGVAEGDPSLLNDARQYIKQKYNKPGNVYLGVVSRLDRLVSGVIVLARTSKAASRLSAQLRDQQFQKTYWCLVPRLPDGQPQGTCADYVVKRDELQKMVVVDSDQHGGKLARLKYRLLGQVDRDYRLEVDLETGRKHQIRVQLAERGAPILGDRKYGSRRKFSPGIALHSRSLTLMHPTKQERMTFEAPCPF